MRRLFAALLIAVTSFLSPAVAGAAKPLPSPPSGTIVIDPWYAPHQQHWGDDIQFDVVVSLGAKDGAFVELSCYLDSGAQVSTAVGPDWYTFYLPVVTEGPGYCVARLRVSQWLGGVRYQDSYPDEVTFPVTCYWYPCV